MKWGKQGRIAALLVIFILVAVLAFFVWKNAGAGETPAPAVSASPAPSAAVTPAPTPTETPPAATGPLSQENGFDPYAVEGTAPGERLLRQEIMAGGEPRESYSAAPAVDFGSGLDYADESGLNTFLNGNFRSSSAGVETAMTSAAFGESWVFLPESAATAPSSSTDITQATPAPDGAVTSTALTGQSLAAVWTRRQMDAMGLYSWTAGLESLTELITPAADGFIYFTDIATGRPTREPMYVGWPFTGSGSLDPRGCPLLYVGAASASAEGGARAFIIDLYTCEILCEFGADESFSFRGAHLADFSGAPLVDAESDTLVWVSGGGVVYALRLGTDWDETADTVSIDPGEPVMWRYYARNSGRFSLGVSGSPVAWSGHVIFADLAGNLICLDLNTMTADWVAELGDETRASVALSLEDGHPYIYAGTLLHNGWNSVGEGEASVWKIDAVTGEAVWRAAMACYTDASAPGGVTNAVAIGEGSLEGLVFTAVARSPYEYSGLFAALDSATGAVVWTVESQDWSAGAPVCVYGEGGLACVTYCTNGGYIYLLDGLTGDVKDRMNLDSPVRSTPAIVGDRLIVGTDSTGLWGIELK